MKPEPEVSTPLPLERLDPSGRCDHEATHHWARYDWACGFLPAGRVLDCACGLGYGSALVRERGAAEVVGVDVSGEAIASARQRYGRDGLTFVQAEATSLTHDQVGVFDLIISLETIEHIAQPQELLDVFGRLLKAGGILALSCPNDRVLGEGNPFHRWVADFGELRGWLTARFACVQAYGEVLWSGTSVWPAVDASIRPDAGGHHAVSTRVLDALPLSQARGFLFACGRERPPPAVPPGATNILGAFRYFRELEAGRLWLDAQRQRCERALTEQEKVVVELRNWTQELESAKSWLTDQVRRQTATIVELRSWIQQLEAARTWHDEHRRQAEARLASAEELQRQQEAKLAEFRAQLTNTREICTQWKRQVLFRTLRRARLLQDLAVDG